MRPSMERWLDKECVDLGARAIADVSTFINDMSTLAKERIPKAQKILKDDLQTVEDIVNGIEGTMEGIQGFLGERSTAAINAIISDIRANMIGGEKLPTMIEELREAVETAGAQGIITCYKFSTTEEKSSYLRMLRALPERIRAHVE